MKLRPLPISIYYILLLGVGLGFLLAFRTYIPYLYWGEADGYIWTRYALPSVVNYTLWPFLIPFVYHNSYKWRLGSRYGFTSNVMAILYALFICVLHELLSNVIYFVPLELMDWYHIDAEVAKYLQGAIPAALINRIIEYSIIVFSLQAVDNYLNLKRSELQMARVESQLTTATLKALRMQLQPHFLFNTLNTISSLLDIDVSKARTVIARFGDILRNVLDAGDQNLIPFSKELDNTKSYLSIEQIRFSDRLSINYDISDACLNALVPAFILQPLVENAIKHGLSKSVGSLNLQVSCSIQENTVNLEVRDDGRGKIEPGDIFKKGVGLSNTQNRLTNLYGDSCHLDIDASDKGFSVKIRLPREDDGKLK